MNALANQIRRLSASSYTLPLALAGSLWLALSAQLAINLPFTPVPITGQTFGVMCLALIMGRKIATLSFLMYLAEGAAGLPVFANATNLFLIGPSFGYLVGMLVASFVVGSLADLGARKSFWLSLSSCYAGSFFIFAFGAWGLSLFVPTAQLFAVGVAPFLIGDFVKNTIAATIASRKFAQV